MTAGKVYTGPDIALWRRWVMRHAWQLAGALIVLWVLLMMSGVAGWRKPTGLATGVFGLFAAMVVLGRVGNA